MKVFVCAVFFTLSAISAGAGESAVDPFELSSGEGPARTLRDFDIDAVVEAVSSAMTEAARNYYLPDEPENKKAIVRYRKNARNLLKYNSTFRRTLGDICVGLANTAVRAVNQERDSLPGKPLSLPVDRTYEPYDEGVSSITVTEGEVMVVFTNTMPCINAAGRALNGGVREQYMPGVPEGSPDRDQYGRGAAAIMSSNGLYNHALAEVCAKLVQAAKRVSEENSGAAVEKRPGTAQPKRGS